jgi:1,6-anhydro-N-acetylmuramate kinase
VESIALNYETHLHRACTAPTGAIDEVIVGGGGAINPTPLKMLGERLGCRVSTHEDYGTPSFAIEAMIEALDRQRAVPRTYEPCPGISGARATTFVGMIAPGYNQFSARASVLSRELLRPIRSC